MGIINKWSGGYFYGSWKKAETEKEEDKDSSYFDKTVDDYESIYRSRYRSSIGYSGLGSLVGGYFRYNYSPLFSSLDKRSAESFKDLSGILIRAVREARDLVVILDFPFQIKISFTDGVDTYEPNCRKILIPTNYFEDSKLTAEDKVKIFCSLAVNEAAHLKYTEARVYNSYTYTLSTTRNKEEIGIIKIILNLLEDERVEDKLLQERPGYLDFVERDKLYQYDKFMEAAKALGRKSKGISFLLNLFKLIRFPKNVDMDIIQEYKNLYEEIGLIISPMPDSTKQTCSAAEKVFDKVKQVLKDIEKDIDIEKGVFKSILSSGIEQSFREISGGFDIDLACNIKPSDIMSPLTSDSACKMMESLILGTAEVGKDPSTYFSVGKNNKHQYLSDKKSIAKYIPGFRKLIKGYDKNFEFNIFGCRAGLLDTNKLAEAYQGIPQVYVRKGISITNKLAVVVLVDESGSMISNGKIEMARRSAILVNEALKNQPGIELFIYGHSGDVLYAGATEINIYRENKKADKFALGSVRAICENRDGVAIYEVAHRVRKLTDSHILMLVISDGSPAAMGYYGEPAIKDVRSKVTEVQKMDIDVVQVSIDYVSSAKRMFDKYIDISGDVANMAKNLSKIIKKLIIKNKNTVITQ